MNTSNIFSNEFHTLESKEFFDHILEDAELGSGIGGTVTRVYNSKTKQHWAKKVNFNNLNSKKF